MIQEAESSFESLLGAHDRRVNALVTRVKQFYDEKVAFRLYHGNTNSTRPSLRSLSQCLDVSHMNHILSVNAETRTCICEPNVSMDTLVDATLAQGLVPLVVTEFPGITVGGAFAGTAGESSSWKHGFFDNIVNWCEVILADGTLRKCSRTNDPDLFRGLKGTFGSLGVGVLFEIQLQEAKPYVELTYTPIRSGIGGFRSYMTKLMTEDSHADRRSQIEFVDGIVFSKTDCVAMEGRIVDENVHDEPLPKVSFDGPWDDWFYLHAMNVLTTLSTDNTKKEHKELIPIKSYLFRYDRGAFWTGKHAYDYFLTPFNRWTRWALDSFMHTRTMYHALHRSGLMHQFVIQDMALPWSNAEPFFNWCHDRLNIYPQWLCPLRIDENSSGLVPRSLRSDSKSAAPDNDDGLSNLMLNIGIWGPAPRGSIATNREIEGKLMEMQGLKWLYAQTFYTPEQFWTIYDEEAYRDLRRRCQAETLPDVYAKVGGTGMNAARGLVGAWRLWPLAGLYGVLSCMKGGDYLRKQ